MEEMMKTIDEEERKMCDRLVPTSCLLHKNTCTVAKQYNKVYTTI